MRQNRMRVIVLGLAVWIVSAASAGCGASPDPAGSSVGAANSSPARPLVGAIRYDAWQPGPLGDGHIAQLGPSRWRYRLPFYGVEINSTTVDLKENTQEVMDQEIAYAHAAGLDFFCFNHYLTEFRKSLDLYLSSTHKNDINFCLQMGSLKNSARVADAVNLINTEPTYQKVAGGRPLVFFQNWYFGTDAPPPTKADVDSFRARVMQAGLPNPYIVVQHFSASRAAADVDRYGADAISSYVMGVRGPSGAVQPFSSLATNAKRDWDAYKNTGKKVIPTVMTGYDPRPITDHPNERCFGYATPQQIAAHLRDALKWSAANLGAAAEANTIQIYAWNEISEGGWLLPSNTAFDPVGTGRLDAIAAVLRRLGAGPPAPVGTPQHPTSLPGTERQGRTQPSHRRRRVLVLLCHKN